MKITVNGVRLYFDVEGAGLRPRGKAMRELPTLLLLHGGPGADHSLFKPQWSALADVAQLVYLDHRGNGRSDRASASTWNLAQWADDVHAFCVALGVRRPVVCGVSFGGIVAMAYATRHPQHPGKLVLVSSTAQGASHAQAKVAMFGQLGGEPARALAQRRFIEGDTSPALLAEWLRLALPLYTRTPPDPLAWPRVAAHADVTAWFNRPGGEGRSFDLLPALGRIACPTLVMGGTLDPMLPIECQRDIAAAVPRRWLTYREFEGCGHGVVHDAPVQALALMRDFIDGSAGS
jgi:pimeloyl-ACP methyl ester carboxylesterase